MELETKVEILNTKFNNMEDHIKSMSKDYNTKINSLKKDTQNQLTKIESSQNKMLWMMLGSLLGIVVNLFGSLFVK